MQLCFCVQKDSSTLNVLKLKVVSGKLSIRKIAHSICNVSYHYLARDKEHFKGLKNGGIFLDTKVKFYNSKSLYRKEVFVFKREGA